MDEGRERSRGVGSEGGIVMSGEEGGVIKTGCRWGWGWVWVGAVKG